MCARILTQLQYPHVVVVCVYVSECVRACRGCFDGFVFTRLAALLFRSMQHLRVTGKHTSGVDHHPLLVSGVKDLQDTNSHICTRLEPGEVKWQTHVVYPKLFSDNRKTTKQSQRCPL